jgi:hypothetical protein
MSYINEVLSALDNEENENILKKTSEQINKEKLDILNDLSLSEENLNEIISKLDEYMYVDEIPDIKYGNYIRWISLNNMENIKLTHGGIVCDIDICDNGVIIKCKNFKNRMFSLHLSKSLIFRKLSNQEKVLLSVSDYLSK